VAARWIEADFDDMRGCNYSANNRIAEGSTRWRSYQVRLRRERQAKRWVRGGALVVLSLGVLLFAGYHLGKGVGYVAGRLFPAGIGGLLKKADSPEQFTTGSSFLAGPWTRQRVRTLLQPVALTALDDKALNLVVEGRRLRVVTTLNVPLQNHILDKFDRKHSKAIGFAAVDPCTGNVLALAGFERQDNGDHPCRDLLFPAASIFKIVTAAAAMETCGLGPDSQLTFNGGKYTLYRSQLKERVHRHTSNITLQDSFAQSVNPVFGKLGALYLGREVLDAYAAAFGFNQAVDGDLSMVPSVVSVPEEPFGLAEIASGFNRRTRMTPLHAATIAAAICHDGILPEPLVVERIEDEGGKTLYENRFSPAGQVAGPETCAALRRCMVETVQTGTARSAFRGLQKSRVLSRLLIGGKTGSINSSDQPHVRYDWFVGFAEEKEGQKALAVAVVVAHEKYIGTRAAEYARSAMEHYFGS